MQTVFELDVFQLVSRPVFGVDALEELHDVLVVLRFGHVGSRNEERDPIVATCAVEISGVEIVPVHEVASLLVDVDDHVDLVASVDVLLSNASERQSDQSALFVESSIGGLYLIVPQPGELA